MNGSLSNFHHTTPDLTIIIMTMMSFDVNKKSENKPSS